MILARAFVVAIFLAILGLAALETAVLWPLIAGSASEYSLHEVGRVSLAAEGGQSRLLGLAVGPTGTVWVADSTLGRLLALDSDGQVLREFSVGEPSGLSADGDSVLMVDPRAGVIRRITLEAGVTDTWEVASFGLSGPGGVAHLDGGTLVVAATGCGFVLLLGEDGQPKGKLGIAEDGRPQLFEPNYPLVDQQGRVYVSDSGNGRVLRWTAAGRPDGTFRTRDRLSAVLSRPRQAALDSQGWLWVADETAGRVWVFDPDGELEGSWQPPGVRHPVGLAIAGERLYLTGWDSSVLYLFELPPTPRVSRWP